MFCHFLFSFLERCSCYTFKNDSPMPWLQAFNYCARKSSNNHLVVMETEREWEFITKEIQTRKGGRENEWHIGLDRNLTTGKWTWINGKTVIIDKWQKGKPRDSDLFTLMAKEFPVGFKGSFSSINRCVSRGWICEEETGINTVQRGLYFAFSSPFSSLSPLPPPPSPPHLLLVRH